MSVLKYLLTGISLLALFACQKEREYSCDCSDNTAETKVFQSEEDNNFNREAWCFGIQNDKNNQIGSPDVTCSVSEL